MYKNYISTHSKQVKMFTRARMNELMKSLDEEKRVFAEQQKKKVKERKEQRNMERVADILLSLSKTPRAKPQ